MGFEERLRRLSGLPGGGNGNGNGHARGEVLPLSGQPNVPILGQPVHIQSITLAASLTVLCRCDPANEPMVVVGRDEEGRAVDVPVLCPKCRKGYKAVLQWQPGQVPGIGLHVIPAPDSAKPHGPAESQGPVPDGEEPEA